MAVQTIGTQAQPGNTYQDPGIYYDKRFLARLKPQLCFEQLGEKRPLPQRSGTMIKWHRLNKLTAVTTPLTEGVNPSEQNVSTSVVTVEPKTYGAYVKVSAELNLKSINPIIEEITDELADQAALSYDTLVFLAIHGNFQNYYCGGKEEEGELTEQDVLNASEVRKAVYKLRKLNVPGYEGNMYKLVIHPACQFDLLSDSAVGSFIDISKYSRPEQLDKGEIGQLYGARVILSTNIPTGEGNNETTFRSFLLGRQAYGITEVSGQGVKTLRQPPGGVSDALEMYSTIGWKFMMAAKVLDPVRGIEIYSGSAAE